MKMNTDREWLRKKAVMEDNQNVNIGNLGDALGLKLRCLRCNHSWLRRTDDAPKCCPNCKSRLWAQERKSAECICEDLGGKRGEVIQCRYCFPVRQPREEGKAK